MIFNSCSNCTNWKCQIRTKEVKAETETNPVTVEDEISKSL